MGLLRYLFITYFRSYKYILPIACYFLLLTIFYQYKQPWVLDSYLVTGILLFFIMGVITVTVFHAEDEKQKQITLLHTKKNTYYHLSLFLICGSIGFFLSIAAVFLPIAFNLFTVNVTLVHAVLGVLCHFSLAFLAVGLSAIFTREIVKNRNETWLWIIVILTSSLIASVYIESSIVRIFLPPIYLVIGIMTGGDSIGTAMWVYWGKFFWIFLYGILIICLCLIIIKLLKSKQ